MSELSLFEDYLSIFSLQLFDRDNPVNKDASNYIFSTEGHIFKLDSLYRGGNEREKVEKRSKIESIGSVTFSPGLNFSQVRYKIFWGDEIGCVRRNLCVPPVSVLKVMHSSVLGFEL